MPPEKKEVVIARLGLKQAVYVAAISGICGIAGAAVPLLIQKPARLRVCLIGGCLSGRSSPRCSNPSSSHKSREMTADPIRERAPGFPRTEGMYRAPVMLGIRGGRASQTSAACF